MKFTKAGFLFVSLTPSLLLADSNENLETTTITAQSPDLLDSIALTEEQIRHLPGTGSIVQIDDLTGRVIKPQDLFEFNPQVYAQSSGTSVDSRLSVRGSGLQRRYGSRGVSLLVDGIPANDADGSFYFRVINPLSIDHINVYPGANGLLYGGSQLGGAINIVQKNGVSDPGAEMTLEYGSFETFRCSVQYGVEQGNWDFFSSYSYQESDGYRDMQNWHSHHFTANLGYLWSDQAQTRFYFLYSDSDAQLAGSLTEDEFHDDPTQSAPGQDPRTDRDLSTIKLSQRTTWGTDKANYAFYTYYQYLDFDHLTGIGVGAFNNLVDYDTDEVGIGFQSENEWQLASTKQILRSNVTYNYGRNEVGGYSGFVPFPGAPVGSNARDDVAANFNLYLENETQFTETDHIFLGAGYVEAKRKRRVEPENDNQTDFDENQGDAVWRVGYLKDLNESNQLFINLSQSFEAAPFSEVVAEVSPQTAQSIEAGSRFQHGFASGQISAYYSQVNDEFIDVEVAPDVYQTTNEDTIHAGLEAYLALDLNDAFNWNSDYQLDFVQSYQLNDFSFDGGQYDGNEIPVVAKHVYAGTLQLTAPDAKWNTAITVDWLPSGIVADNKNTIESDGYNIWKWSLELNVNQHLTLYGGVDNIFDEAYVSSVTVNPSSDAYLSPGDGRAAYLGATLKW
ncbi:TonB-dependent receptor family protein [Rubritalea spongiae]|uniref:TonB-dependent receptor family protein n=1 Tax=Rubritalea spongiae TaxID=430797 RepID=A0ABW5E4F6_9BACT